VSLSIIVKIFQTNFHQNFIAKTSPDSGEVCVKVLRLAPLVTALLCVKVAMFLKGSKITQNLQIF
jgi:hypothetical protein